MDRPLTFNWDGECLKPCHPRVADKHLVVGERYTLIGYEERSTVSHRHEFAWLHNAWHTLPEALADLYPTPEHLRKRALIEAGFYTEQAVDAGSHAAALRVAAAFRSREEFSLVIVRGPIVIIRTAKSQSRRSMDKDEFQRSKQAIIDVITDMVGVSQDELEAGNPA